MVEIADLALRAVINLFEIYTINDSLTNNFFSLKYVINCYEKMTHTNFWISLKISPSVEISDLALTAVINFCEIYTINYLIKNYNLRPILLCPKLYFG